MRVGREADSKTVFDKCMPEWKAADCHAAGSLLGIDRGIAGLMSMQIGGPHATEFPVTLLDVLARGTSPGVAKSCHAAGQAIPPDEILNLSLNSEGRLTLIGECDTHNATGISHLRRTAEETPHFG
jgi:hypothetical protein